MKPTSPMPATEARAFSGAFATLVGTLALCLAPAPGIAETFPIFESGHVRPAALSADGRQLYVVNTPDARLEVFRVTRRGLRHLGSVRVGLEPVAVAAHPNGQIWVVNHLSDSVTVFQRQPGLPRTIDTLLVGDEPSDIVFAGPERNRAFITAAHRGPNSPYPRGEYATRGIGRADVWVFELGERGADLRGEPAAVLTLFSDKPRALATSPDGRFVYAAAFHSGNRTTTVHERVVCDGGESSAPCPVGDALAPGGAPAPNANIEGDPAPESGLIVRYRDDSGTWNDELGRDWSEFVRFELPDLDVFQIDAAAPNPHVVRSVASVGTVLFNMAVNPRTGALYVTNTEATNEVRFEGAGELSDAFKPAGVPASVRGRFSRSRITVVTDEGVEPRYLNKHIPYDVVPSPPGIAERSLATPMGIEVSRDGERLYVAAMGSDEIGIFDIASLEDDSFVPDASRQIAVPGGPTGFVLDERRDRLYAVTRLDSAVSVFDLSSGRRVQRVPLHNPEPAKLQEGRQFLYDARLTSSNGEVSCASCHVFGDMDDLAWDLGDPDGAAFANSNPQVPFEDLEPVPFHPMKGPMTTQTLRGMADHGPMHWRGDRTGGSLDSGDPLDETLAFEAFNVAFEGLLGRGAPLSTEQMSSFAAFALQLVSPPNPIQRLDGSPRPDEASGRELFFDAEVFNPDPRQRCETCHASDPKMGFFGTKGETNNGFKVPHLRNLYQKVGMFGFPKLNPFFGADLFLDRVDHGHQGAQIRGFGYTHDGSVDSLHTFLAQITFLLDESEIADVEAFLMAFESEMAPVVGQQVTLHAGSSAEAIERAELLATRALTPRPSPGNPSAHECDLAISVESAAFSFSWLLQEDGNAVIDRERGPRLPEPWLRWFSRWPGVVVTYTCVPPGTGVRHALDRDGDGFLDGDERAFGSDPADAGSIPRARRPSRE
jgi:DNA-binding beta-propeller fold protein YncE